MPSFGKILALTTSFLLLSINLFLIRPIFAQQPNFTTPPVYEITTGIPSAPTPKGLTFFVKNFDLDYQGGKVILSSSPDGTGSTLVDDAIRINIVTSSGALINRFDHPYSSGCNPLVPLAPTDISYLLTEGLNHIKLTLYDICGAFKSSTPLYLVTENLTPSPTPTPSSSPSPSPSPSPSGPEPFLDLPWDYGANGMSFNEAATSINAYFDHEYPLLSTNLLEPSKTLEDLVNFEGIKDRRFPYSKHDGYDYGTSAKTKLGTPILAPSPGEATFMSSCTPCGNAILIDHKNGFQTRYYHMQPDGLIVNTPGQKVNVTKGQQIGKVGFSGNVNPPREPGSHLHFMVIQDKNKDGNFEDNIPDGITDPFGWQSTGPDPWENYNFSYAGAQRTGNKSYYLFTKKLDNLNANLTANQAVFNIGKTKLEFPQGTTNQNLNLTINSAPNFADNLLNSLGSIISVEAKNSAGELVTTFLKNFSLTINFSQFDLSRFNIDTLSIFSSPDGDNWTKENTDIDLNGKTATTSINHLTYFALMAARKDIFPPFTTPILEGEEGIENNFRSDVKVNLNAVDNPGGLGVEFTSYKTSGEDWQVYTAPLNFTNEGSYKIEFYSQDNDGNIEEVKSVEFLIDKTPPEVKANPDRLPDFNEWFNHPLNVNFTGVDQGSGIKSCDLKTYNGPDSDNASLEGVCTDNAGNIGSAVFNFKYDSTFPKPSLSANPSSLWPPNGKLVDVTITGSPNEAYLSSLKFSVEDEYKKIEPALINFGDIIKLEAKRDGSDKDGRVYTIKVSVQDLAGNKSDAKAEVIVPHNQ